MNWWFTIGHLENYYYATVVPVLLLGKKKDILSVPIADNVNSSLEKYFSSELLTSENEWFCPSCNSCIESINNTLIIQSSFILMKHLKRFCVERDKVIKDNQFFKCYPADLLQIRITDSNEFSYLNNYSLGSTINHSGSLNNGYY